MARYRGGPRRHRGGDRLSAQPGRHGHRASTAAQELPRQDRRQARRGSRVGMRRVLIDVTPLRSSRAFRRLWIGQTCSGFGSQMTLVAVMFQIWQATGSTAWTGAVGLARAVPIIAFGLFAGSISDRVDRRTFYLITTTGQAACSTLLAVQGLLGHLPAPGVLLVIALQSCFVAGGGPASRTFIPRLLPEHQIPA